VWKPPTEILPRYRYCLHRLALGNGYWLYYNVVGTRSPIDWYFYPTYSPVGNPTLHYSRSVYRNRLSQPSPMHGPTSFLEPKLLSLILSQCDPWVSWRVLSVPLYCKTDWVMPYSALHLTVASLISFYQRPSSACIVRVGGFVFWNKP
jgi:hypothetical protein